jgi:glucose-1-phosphate adenylyltransferase
MEIGMQQVDTSVLGLSPEEAKKMPYIASMGIYVFRKDILLNLLRSVEVVLSSFVEIFRIYMT